MKIDRQVLAIYIYTVDPTAMKMLVSNGCSVIAERKDMKGQSVWVLKAHGLIFDLSEEPYRGKCFASNTCTLVFNAKKKVGEK